MNLEEIMITPPFILVMFLVGLVLIIKGGDWFVDAASWFAEVFGIPKFLIGATIVSIATTLPELTTSVFATVGGSVDIAAGNAIGSVTANMALIMALTVVFLPAVVERKSYAQKTLLMILSCVVLLIGSLSGYLGLVPTFILLAIFGYYTYGSIVDAKKSMADSAGDERPHMTSKALTSNIIKFVVGTLGIVLGAKLLVDYGQELARIIGISEGVIGVTVIAVGTSLPELVTAITAIRKKETALSVGNIIGANIIDLTVILPVCSLISGGRLVVPKASYALDLPVTLIVMAVAVIPTIFAGKYRKWQGAVMLAIYAGYLFVRCAMPEVDSILKIFG
ncbi:MAG: calcium/sodium antiporter [Clostridia bacterium]|nr:calcium/sodium antiporter [Clostridia bacterium]